MKYISQTMDFISYENGEAVEVESQTTQYYLAKSVAKPEESDTDWETGWTTSMPNPYGQTDEGGKSITCYVWQRQKTLWSNGQTTYLGVMPISEYEVIDTLAKNDNKTMGQWCRDNNITFIDGSTIITGTIDADRIDVANLAAINADLGTVTAGTIDASQVTVTNLDASEIKTGILASKNYKPGNTSVYAEEGMCFDLDNETITSTKLSINDDGAWFNGTVVAQFGDIGGWDITPALLKSGNVGLSSADVSNTDPNPIRIYAGNTTAANAPFKVYNNGAMHSTSGDIAGWTIDTNTLTSGQVGLSSAGTSDDSIRIYAGDGTASEAPFRVYNDGSMSSTKGDIGGWTIDEDTLYSNDSTSTTSCGLKAGGSGLDATTEFTFTLNTDGTHYYVGKYTGSASHVHIPGVHKGMIITVVQPEMFKNNSNLQTLTISDGPIRIGERCCYSCTNLTTLVLPSSIKDISALAFDKCTKLTDVYYAGTQEQWAAISIATSNTSLTNATIHYNLAGLEDDFKYSLDSLVSAGGLSPVRLFSGHTKSTTETSPIPSFANAKPKFAVLEDGSMYASAAHISGDIVSKGTHFGVHVGGSANIDSTITLLYRPLLNTNLQL